MTRTKILSLQNVLELLPPQLTLWAWSNAIYFVFYYIKIEKNVDQIIKLWKDKSNYTSDSSDAETPKKSTKAKKESEAKTSQDGSPYFVAPQEKLT